MRPIHPQSVPGEPRAVRWVTEVDLPVGEVVAAPSPLGLLMDDGVLTRMMVERTGVWTWLAQGRTWASDGLSIRDAVVAAVDMEGWQITDGSAELLGLVARDVLEGELASYVTSHGGVITVAEATRSTLSLHFGGACRDCPAVRITLHARIGTAVRSRYPLLTDRTRTL